MAIYQIVFCKIHDRDRFIPEYAIPTSKLVAKHGGEYVVRAPGLSCLEGDVDENTSVVISKWPDLQTLEAMWTSPEYETLKQLRRETSDAQIVVVEQPET
ncbi:MAG: DUF1330 domain-containing protein [Pseudomonadota bacterium]|jgi:uncharacterized protein (DUF1330 family)|nr:DUF1330 domain-containing protein [Pseudomonadota bacterium]